MATFTVVGTSSIATPASSDPQSWAVPQPVGTEETDLLVLGFLGGAQYTITDPRLTVQDDGGPGYEVGGYGAAVAAGGYGWSDDVTFDSHDDGFGSGAGPGLAIVAAVRTVGYGPPDAFGDVGGDGALFHPFGDQAGYYAGLAMVSDLTDIGGSAVAPWVTEEQVTLTIGDYPFSVVCASFSGADPVPELTVPNASGLRYAFWLLWPTPVLPVVPGLRVRQIIPPERVRGRIPPERVRQIIP